MYENVPNFQDPALLWEGMTSLERDDVLRYQTDETGGIIVEIDSEGVEHKLARPEYHIKAYMCDPNGPIKADKAVTWVWNINQVVDHILKTEAELGLIIKVKKPSTTPESAEQPAERETNMPGRTVRTVRTTGPAKAAAPAATAPVVAPAKPTAAPAPVRRAQPKPAPAPAAATPDAAAAPARTPARAPMAPAAAPAGRVGNPPARRVATPAGAPGRVMSRPAGAPAAAAPKNGAAPADAGVSQDQLEKAIFNMVNPMFEELLNAVKAAQQTSIDCATILGDIAGQTGGTFQVKKVDAEGNYMVREDNSFIMETPQLWTHPSKIFAHVEGTGFNPENLHTVGEEDEEAPAGEGGEEVPAEEEIPE